MTATLTDETDANFEAVLSTAVGSRAPREWEWAHVVPTGVLWVAAVVLARYAGGLGLALLFAGVLSVATALALLRSVAPHTAMLAAFTLVLGWMYCVTALVIPALTSLSITRSLFFGSEPMDFTAREYVFDGSLELRRWVVVALMLIPTATSASWLIVARSKRRTLSTRALLPLAGMAGLISVPLLAAAWLKSTDPYRLLAPTMSGDGRNFLLHTQRIRVDSQFESITGLFGQGDFGPAISALISKASGARGLFQITDQFAIAATYLFAASMIVCSMVHIGIQMAKGAAAPGQSSKYLTVSVAIVSGLLGSLLASNQWTMNEVFRSGFFSLYVAFAFTALWVAIHLGMNLRDIKWWMGILIVLVLLFVSYQPAAILPAIVSTSYVGVLVWPVVRSQWRKVALSLAALSLVAWWSGLVPAFVSRAQDRTMLPGAIMEVGDWFLVALLPLGVGLALIGSGVARRIAMVLIPIAPTSWVLLWWFTQVREARGETSFGYYGEKFLYLALFLALTCTVSIVLFIIVLAGSHRAIGHADLPSGRLSLVGGPAGVLLIGVGAAMVASQAGPSSTILTVSRTGWNQPTAGIAREVFSHWSSDEAIFIQFADPGNDRIANFWGPLFWSGDRWAWVYGNPTDHPETVCALMAPGPVTLVTTSQDYANLLESVCPDVFDSIKVIT